MRTFVRAWLLSLAALSLGLLGGCTKESSEDPLGSKAATGGLSQPVNVVTGQPLEYFKIYDDSALKPGPKDIGQPQAASRVPVSPGTSTTLVEGGGVVELVFGPKSLSSETEIDLIVHDSSGDLSFEFGPEGLSFDPRDPVLMRFFPHVTDPDHLNDWAYFDIFYELVNQAFEPLTTVHSMEAWTDPATGATTLEYCISVELAHFSKYAALR